jgi:hypothetical protein
MLPFCRHIKTSGHRCAGIARRGNRFCYHHDHMHIERAAAQASAARSGPSSRRRSIDPPPTP